MVLKLKTHSTTHIVDISTQTIDNLISIQILSSLILYKLFSFNFRNTDLMNKEGLVLRCLLVKIIHENSKKLGFGFEYGF